MKTYEELEDAHLKNIEMVQNQRKLLILKYNVDPGNEELNLNTTNSELLFVAKTISDEINEKIKRSQIAEIQDVSSAVVGDAPDMNTLKSETIGDTIDKQDTVSVNSRASSATSVSQRQPKIPPKTNKAAQARKVTNPAFKSRVSSASRNIFL